MQVYPYNNFLLPASADTLSHREVHFATPPDPPFSPAVSSRSLTLPQALSLLSSLDLVTPALLRCQFPREGFSSDPLGIAKPHSTQCASLPLLFSPYGVEYKCSLMCPGLSLQVKVWGSRNSFFLAHKQEKCIRPITPLKEECVSTQAVPLLLFSCASSFLLSPPPTRDPDFHPSILGGDQRTSRNTTELSTFRLGVD